MKSDRLKTRKTIVVTGGLGFIGSHFVERALAEGHRIINIDKITYAANSWLEFKGDYQLIKEDIAEINDIPFCDIIVNFAAESHVDNSIVNASNFIDTNVLGVHNLLEIIKRHKITNMQTAWGYVAPLFVQISTDEVFGDILEGAFNESDRHKPSNPYAATKSCAEQLVVAWGRTYDLPYIITRTTNNYGLRQHAEKLIPSTITRILCKERAIMHGDGRYVRNWIHVEDNVDAIFKVIDHGTVNTSYNIASDEEFSVKQIIENVLQVVTTLLERKPIAFSDAINTSTDRSGCDERYALHNQSVINLGWKQNKHLLDALPDIVDYYREKHGIHK